MRPFQIKQRFAGLTIPCLLLWLFVASWAEAQTVPLELKVKAAYLLNFGRYVRWPPEVLHEKHTICIVGPDPFGPLLDKTVDGREVQGHTVQTRRLSAHETIVGTCHILFISPALPLETQAAVLREVSGQPILTVGDANEFLDMGGMVKFVHYQDTIRFSVNLVAVRRASLDMSSRVLSIAISVRQEDLPRE